jgi:type VI secretion system protein ImpL
MDKARPIVAPAATDTNKDPSPLIDFLPVFRVDQAAESGGNQLTDWTLQVGQDAFRYRETPHPGRWRYGAPIRLSLRWAKDSPAVPTPVSAAGLRVEGRSAVFDLGGKWSLFRLIRQREAAASDFASAADFKPSVLKFSLMTQPDTTWMRVGEAPPPKELKIFIQMLSPDGKSALTLPPLPSTAPELTAAPNGENRE